LLSALGDSVLMETGKIGEEQEAGWSKWLVAFAGFDEARGRILALGRAVEVVEPLPLRLSVIDFAQQIGDMYTDDHP